MIVAIAAALVAAAAPGQVAVTDHGFRPRTLAVKRGQAVTWTWTGRRRHDVFVWSGPERGRPAPCRRRRAGSCTRRLPVRGTYDYACTLHGSMTGRVRVR